jgi:hypothetical protein
VNRLSHRLSDTPGRIFGQASSLIRDTLSSEMIVPSNPANTFLESAGQLAADSNRSLLCSPAKCRPGGVLGIPRFSRVLHRGTGEHNVSSNAETGGGDHPGKHLHETPQPIGCKRTANFNESDESFFAAIV